MSETAGGNSIMGTAVFQEDGTTANLHYKVVCAPDWSSQTATVKGWIGARIVDFAAHADGDTWRIDGAPLEGSVTGLCDVDLGFTPATNTNAIRRLRLDVGQSAETTALWLDVDNWRVKPLRQVYRRLSAATYEYTSPDHDYQTVLSVNDTGLITEYPDLWVADPSGE